MSDHVLLNLLNEFGKIDKMWGFSSIPLLFCEEFNNSIIQEHECQFLSIIWPWKYFDMAFSLWKC